MSALCKNGWAGSSTSRWVAWSKCIKVRNENREAITVQFGPSNKYTLL